VHHPAAELLSILEHPVAGGAVDVDDEADATGVMLQGGVVQTLRLWEFPACFIKRHVGTPLVSFSPQAASDCSEFDKCLKSKTRNISIVENDMNHIKHIHTHNSTNSFVWYCLLATIHTELKKVPERSPSAN